jgi:protein SCO1/2
MTDKQQSTNPLPLIALALLALIIGITLSKWQSAPGKAPQISGTILPKPRPLPDVRLTDNKARPLTPDSLKGKWTLMFFGYTNCPDICPAALTVLQQAAGLMEQKPPVMDKVRILFVSVDPQRDTPAVLDKYVKYFHKAFMGATADDKTLKLLTRRLGIVYYISKKDKAGRYTVDHSAQILLLDRQARLYAVFTGPHDARKLATDIRTLIKASR